MSRRDDHVSLVDMLIYAREAVGLLGVATLDDLVEDRVKQLALTKLVEVVGEAARRVSGDTRRQNASIPWAQIIGLRNRLVHAYDDIDLEILWSIVRNDLPPLIEKLEFIVKDER